LHFSQRGLVIGFVVELTALSAAVRGGATVPLMTAPDCWTSSTF
jgi:hypothetical protein